MRKVMNAILLSCRKATEFVEKQRHCSLDRMEGFQLQLHLAICKDCSNYAKQTNLIDRLLNRKPGFTPTDIDSSSLEERIITNIKNKS